MTNSPPLPASKKLSASVKDAHRGPTAAPTGRSGVEHSFIAPAAAKGEGKETNPVSGFASAKSKAALHSSYLGGVLCNTPPWDYTIQMERIYSNFDGLDVAFQGIFPKDVREKLKEAKEQAQKTQSDCLCYIGKKNTPVLVGETGSRGGYAFRFDTGPDGETWFVKDSDKRNDWCIRVSTKSQALALYGYEGVKERLWAHLGNFGAVGPYRIDTKTKQPNETPIETISRVDYCFDFVSKDFKPNAEHIVCHARSKRQSTGQLSTTPIDTVQTGEIIETLRIGKMPNKQITIYNKTREVSVKADKKFFWDVWAIDQDSFEDQIWRVEIRAGKNELKKWNINRFKDLEARIGDLFKKTLKGIRYVVPCTDSNVSRWPNSALWEMCTIALETILDPYISNADPATVKEAYRESLKAQRLKMIEGLIPGLMAALDKEPYEIEETLIYINKEIHENIRQAPNRFAEKCEKAKEKIVFLEPYVT